MRDLGHPQSRGTVRFPKYGPPVMAGIRDFELWSNRILFDMKAEKCALFGSRIVSQRGEENDVITIPSK